MVKEDKMYVCATIRKSVVEKRNLKKSDLLLIANRLNLDDKIESRVIEIKEQALEYAENRVMYFEKVGKLYKVCEYQEINERILKLFDYYIRSRFTL